MTPALWTDCDPAQLARLRQDAWRWFDCDLYDLDEYGLRGLLYTLQARVRILEEEVAEQERRIVAMRAAKDQEDTWFRQQVADAVYFFDAVAGIRSDGLDELEKFANREEGDR